ncbi:MAG TPA: metallophosphoesterase [Nitrosopumilaceae archaeon]|nr:metallophosphoesterase [Nitrosopumilaceae archaeon]
MVQTRPIQSQPALILEEEKKRYLVVTDLHIGFENTFLSNEIHVEPKELVQETVDSLLSIIEYEKPDVLVLLGDVKSGIDFISKIEWQAVPLFFEIGKKIETILIPGNHDSNIQKLLPEGITLVSSSGLVVGDTLLTHGHTMPSENLSQVNKIVMGHVHPVFFQEGSVVDGQRVWVSIRAEKNQLFPSSKGTLEIIILPAFNKYFYATYKKYYKKSISPILQSIKNFQSAKIVTLDGSIIGNESMLENVI